MARAATIRILNRGRPRQRVAVTMQTLDDVHVLAVKIPAQLIKPTGAVESNGFHHHRVAFPMADGFTVPRAVQVFDVGVLAAVGRYHAVAGGRGDQAALARVRENQMLMGV